MRESRDSRVAPPPRIALVSPIEVLVSFCDSEDYVIENEVAAAYVRDRGRGDHQPRTVPLVA